MLVQAVAPHAIDLAPYEAFREGLLRHIGIEEKILFVAARRVSGGRPLPIVRQLHLDHAALAAMMVPTPSAALVAEVRALLGGHNRIEEQPGGLYEACDALLGGEIDSIVARVRAAPPVPVSAFSDKKLVFDHIERLLVAAGHARRR